MDIDSITPQDMRFNPPSFDAAKISKKIADEYNLEGELRPLVGERDQNFQLQAAHGKNYVVKIAGQDEDPDITDFQVQALLYLEQGNPLIPVPLIVRTNTGANISKIGGADGVNHAVRVVSYLDGIPYGEGTPPDTSHLQKIGSFMGEMVNALKGFDHKASKHFMPWSLSNGIAVSRDLWAGAAQDITTLAAPMLERLRSDVLPSLNACPSQVIHNDGHSYNLLRADAVSQDVVGIIDFGDMVYAPIVNELAVTATTFQRPGTEGLSTIENLLLGFHRTHPLSDTEVSLLWDAIILRLLITVLLSDVKLAIGSKQDPDVFEDRTEAYQLLKKASQLDHAATVNQLRAVCGYGQGK
ncbi:MAG: phosphotransferase [Halioglobus sp.]